MRGMMRCRERVQVLKSTKVLLRPCSMLCIQDHQTARRSAVHRESVENCVSRCVRPPSEAVSCARGCDNGPDVSPGCRLIFFHAPLELYTFVEKLDLDEGRRGEV